MTSELEHARLLEVLSYDPLTGVFIWKTKRRRYIKAGEVAGRRSHSQGYVRIIVDGHDVLAHRLAWFYVHGRWPAHEIDHIDGDVQNNRIANLREATREQNCRNTRLNSNNTSGFKGVAFNKHRGLWHASIRVNYRRHSLGYFATPEEAGAAYKKAAVTMHGEFAPIPFKN